MTHKYLRGRIAGRYLNHGYGRHYPPAQFPSEYRRRRREAIIARAMASVIGREIIE